MPFSCYVIFVFSQYTRGTRVRHGYAGQYTRGPNYRARRVGAFRDRRVGSTNCVEKARGYDAWVWRVGMARRVDGAGKWRVGMARGYGAWVWHAAWTARGNGAWVWRAAWTPRGNGACFWRAAWTPRGNGARVPVYHYCHVGLIM